MDWMGRETALVRSLQISSYSSHVLDVATAKALCSLDLSSAAHSATATRFLHFDFSHFPFFFRLDRGFHHEHKIKLKFLVPFFFKNKATLSFHPRPICIPLSICRRFVHVVCVCVSFGIQQPTSSGVRSQCTKHEIAIGVQSQSAKKSERKLN